MSQPVNPTPAVSPEMMSEPLAYLKGEFVPASQCKLSIYDLGIVLGAAVTDFLRTFNHEPFRM